MILSYTKYCVLIWIFKTLCLLNQDTPNCHNCYTYTKE
ncbi:hypothetical protein [Caudoviricetes sp.]|nr:hypothetical protein [Caudoviricetes sp.]